MHYARAANVDNSMLVSVSRAQRSASSCEASQVGCFRLATLYEEAPEVGSTRLRVRCRPGDRYEHRMCRDPGSAAHRSAQERYALHRIRDTLIAYLSAYGIKPAHDDEAGQRN